MTYFSKLTIVVLSFSFLFISCKDDNITSSDKEKSKEEVQVKNIGYYHNQALDLVLNDKNIDVDDLSYFDLRQVVTEKLVEKYPDKFSKGELEADRSSINAGLVESGFLKFKTIPSKSSDLSSTDPEFTGDYKLVIDNLHENNEISKNLTSKLLKLYGNMSDWAAKESPVKYAEEVISKESLSEQDQKFASAFLSVLEASNNYWSDKTIHQRIDNGKVKISDKKCEGSKEQGLEETAADATGALYGMVGGPGWSVVEGAIFTGVAVLNDGTC